MTTTNSIEPTEVTTDAAPEETPRSHTATQNHNAKNPGRVLITGGASGLGAAAAAAVEAAGGTAIILDRTQVESDRGLSIVIDIADDEAVLAAVDQAAGAFGGLDAVITAAGIDKCGRLDEVSAQDWNRVVQVNLFGTVSVVRAALPHLRETHGRVVTVASSLGLRALPEASAYCASKFAVIGFSQSLAAETRGQIGVTTLIPAGMKTKFFDDRDEKYRPGDDAKLNDPALVADAIMFVLNQPKGCEVRELVICHEEEPSWP